MGPRFACFLLILSATLQWGCGGGGGSQPPPDPLPIVLVTDQSQTTSGELSLAWSYPTSSYKITGVNIYRSSSAGGLSNYAQMAALAFPASSYADLTVQEGITYDYRITCVTPAGEGAPVPAATGYLPFLAPTQAAIAFTPSGALVSWTNRNPAIQGLNLQGLWMPEFGSGGGGTDLNQALPGGTASFLDPDLSPGPRTYVIQVNNAPLFSPYRTVSGYSPGSGAPAFQGGNLELLEWDEFAVQAGQLDASGAWSLAFLTNTGAYEHLAQVNGDWAVTLLADTKPVLAASPSFTFDGEGYPHYVFLAGSASGSSTQDVIHTWQDASGWKRETVASRSILLTSTSIGVLFGMNKAGTIGLAWQLASDPTGGTLEFATNETGPWVITPLPLGPVQPQTSSYSYVMGPMALAMAPDGTAHLAFLCNATGLGNAPGLGAGLLAKHRRPFSAWTEELVVASGSLRVTGYDPLAIRPLGPSGLAIAYEQVDPAAGIAQDLYDTMLATSSGTGWAPPVVMATRGSSGTDHQLWLATTDDGSRAAVAAVTPLAATSSLEVYTLGSGSAAPQKAILNAHTTTEMPHAVALAFDSANKAHLLFTLGHGTLEPGIMALQSYVELP